MTGRAKSKELGEADDLKPTDDYRNHKDFRRVLGIGGSSEMLRCGPVRSRALAEQLTHKHAPEVCVSVWLVNPFSP